MGISLIHETSLPGFTALQQNIILYLSISAMLHVLLTSMIVVRHLRHIRSMIRAGASTGAIGSYREDLIAFIEPNILYAIAYLLCMASVISGSSVRYIFGQVIDQVQVRTVFYYSLMRRNLGKLSSDHSGEQAIVPFLIIRHFANRRALAGQTIASGKIGSILSNGRRKSTCDDEPFFYEIPPRSMETNGKAPGEPGTGDKTYADEAPRKALDSPTSRLGSAYPDSIRFRTQGEADGWR